MERNKPVFVRKCDLVGNPARPDVVPLVPLSAATLWRMVKAGTFPAPVKLAARVTAWRLSDVETWCTERKAAERGSPIRRKRAGGANA